MHSTKEHVNGWLNIYKPKNYSSASIVAILKKRLNIKRKIGHAGTLDVAAEGVLPIAVGKATKLIEFLVNQKKEYIFTTKFGMKTDTADLTGKIIKSSKIIPSYKECYNICSEFIGKNIQIPNKYSAIKIKGVRAYSLARQNIDFHIPPREINIFKLNCIKYNYLLKSASFYVQCSKGTYVRNIAEDIADKFASFAFITELQRLSVGKFHLRDSVRIFDCLKVASTINKNLLVNNMYPSDYVLDKIQIFSANSDQMSRIASGRSCIFNTESYYGSIAVMYSGRVISIGQLRNKTFIPKKVLI